MGKSHVVKDWFKSSIDFFGIKQILTEKYIFIDIQIYNLSKYINKHDNKQIYKVCIPLTLVWWNISYSQLGSDITDKFTVQWVYFELCSTLCLPKQIVYKNRSYQGRCNLHLQVWKNKTLNWFGNSHISRNNYCRKTNWNF